MALLSKEIQCGFAGWNRNAFGNNNTVLINVEFPGYNALLRDKKRDPKAEIPTIMFFHDDLIFFAKKGGNEIFNFNTKTQKFKRIALLDDLTVVAMCGAETEVYFLDGKSPEYIRILDSSSRPRGIIPTALGKSKVLWRDGHVIDLW